VGNFGILAGADERNLELLISAEIELQQMAVGHKADRWRKTKCNGLVCCCCDGESVVWRGSAIFGKQPRTFKQKDGGILRAKPLTMIQTNTRAKRRPDLVNNGRNLREKQDIKKEKMFHLNITVIVLFMAAKEENSWRR
jgi:hypothetical protein